MLVQGKAQREFFTPWENTPAVSNNHESDLLLPAGTYRNPGKNNASHNSAGGALHLLLKASCYLTSIEAYSGKTGEKML